MKRYIAIVALIIGCIGLQCQARHLRFIYIQHEPNTPSSKLFKIIDRHYKNVEETGDALIIYLSTGRSSDGFGRNNYGLVSISNLTDYTYSNLDSRESYDILYDALVNTNYHNVEPRADVRNVLTLFDYYNIFNADGSKAFDNVSFDCYVGSRCWTLHYNETVLAHIYAALDVPAMPRGYFDFNVYYPEDDHVTYKEENLFGNKNLQNINNEVLLMKY